MGPERPIARPSAKNFKKNIWRPLAALIVAGSSLVYSEDRSSINSQIFPPKELSPGSFSIAGLIAEPDADSQVAIDRSDCSQIKGTDYQSDSERDWYLKNCLQQFLKANPDTPAVTGWLDLAGWPSYLWQEAAAVIYCESRNSPDAYNLAGPHYGLFQLDAPWFSYAGEDLNLWEDPVVNARVALATYNYDLERGQAPWTQWGCRPPVL